MDSKTKDIFKEDILLSDILMDHLNERVKEIAKKSKMILILAIFLLIISEKV